MRLAIVLITLAGAAVSGATPQRGGQVPAALPAAYQIVTTADYEGAIIPSSVIPPMLKPDDASGTWTPTPANVEMAERQLKAFIQQAVRNPNRVADLIPVNEDITLEGLPSVLSGLATYKRQYIGLTYGTDRHLLVHGLPDDPEHAWRLRFHLAMEGSCRFWWYEFSVSDQKVLSFNCQGIS